MGSILERNRIIDDVIDSEIDLTLMSLSPSLEVVDPASHWADPNFPASRFSSQSLASLPRPAHSVLEQAQDLWDSG